MAKITKLDDARRARQTDPVRAQLEARVVAAVSALFDHTGGAAFRLPLGKGRSRTVCAGSIAAVKDMVSLDPSKMTPYRGH